MRLTIDVKPRLPIWEASFCAGGAWSGASMAGLLRRVSRNSCSVS
jgi:hypothetical protein